MYTLRATDDYLRDRKRLEKQNKKLIARVEKILYELKCHPRQGIGKVERLKHYAEREIYSRRIDREHRLIYEIREDDTVVILMAAFGHYQR